MDGGSAILVQRTRRQPRKVFFSKRVRAEAPSLGETLVQLTCIDSALAAMVARIISTTAR